MPKHPRGEGWSPQLGTGHWDDNSRPLEWTTKEIYLEQDSYVLPSFSSLFGPARLTTDACYWAEQEEETFWDNSQLPPLSLADEDKFVDPSNTSEHTYWSGPPDSAVNPVDLTKQGATICYGSLCDVKVRLLPDAAILISNTKDKLAQCNLFDNGDLICVQICQSDTEHDIAVVNTKYTTAFQELRKSVPMISTERLEAVVNVQTWKEARRAAKGRIQNIISTIEINIYGNPDYAPDVSVALSKLHLFLQTPEILRDTTQYLNPQLLVFSSIGSSPCDDSMLNNDATYERAVVSDFIEILDTSLNHLELEEVHADERVRSHLHTHQRIGLDFVLRRETSVLSNSLKLWREDEQRPNSTTYYHIITGDDTKQMPDETRGGIIADEPGLGKTLTMLAAIVSFLDRARKFGEDFSICGINGRFACKATLIVVPSQLVLENVWVTEIAKHIKTDGLKIHKYHGFGKEIDHERLRSVDIVLTTYATVLADFRSHKFFRSVHWFRIVLDEAHNIRTPTTQQFHDIAALPSELRWCLTGTPIQNKLQDLGALLTFLRVPIFSEPDSFRQYIIQPAMTTNVDRFANLRTLLGALCLRRTKATVQLAQPIAEPVSQRHFVEFTAEEREEYKGIGETCRRAFDLALTKRNVRGAREVVLAAIQACRHFCNTGIALKEWTSAIPAGSNIPIAMGQNHEATTIDLSRLHNKSATYIPTKLRALVTDIVDCEKGTKCLVFSFWKESLNIVDRLLRAQSVSIHRIDGDLSVPERRKALEEFEKNQHNVSVLLMTFSTGGEGLNISIANRIFILEPQWNPQVEKQAIGRAIRLGQRHKVVVTRYIVKDSIEDLKVQGHQITKLQLASGGFSDRAANASENSDTVSGLQEIVRTICGV